MDYLPFPPVEADRIELFDTERTETQYLIFGGHRHTYACTDPDKSYGQHLSTWIPMGYKILRFAQKVAVLRHGDVVRQWPVVRRDPRVDPREQPPGTTLYLDNWRRSVCGYLIVTPSTGASAPPDAYDPDSALTSAAAASLKDGHAVLLYVYHAENWH